ncbi:hypothetical protein BGP82_25255 [Pseudomonas putida]|uniref:Uncharacterized protein n=1 Tax=Pseudomonas putida TaxID=303 RepID=A0A2S3WTB1_PSEPU|nr:hypothetical protein [Pseudomonas putida]POG04551.1 hypothetical protein BGP82_25255 [Pseudomonas putida]
MKSSVAYYIKQAFIGQVNELDLSESTYQDIIQSKGILSAALSIEEKYDLVLGNFLDLERELLLLTMDGLTNSSFSYDRAYKVISMLNRRVANFIYFGKNYTELIASMASKCVPAQDKERIQEKIKLLTNQLYDASIEYQFAEALRGHITHSADAVHTVSSPSNWTMNEARKADQLVFNLEIFSLKDRLLENSSFKRAVLNKFGDKIDLKKVARKYMGSISELQTEVRKAIKDSVAQARRSIEFQTERYGEVNHGETFGLAVYSRVGCNEDSKPLSISLDWDDVRLELEQRNESISNMDRRYISSAIIPGKLHDT